MVVGRDFRFGKDRKGDTAIKGVTFLETHLFEFNKNIYGKELTVEFLTFIRPEKKFKDFKSLTNQIKKDVRKAKKYHKI